MYIIVPGTLSPSCRCPIMAMIHYCTVLPDWPCTVGIHIVGPGIRLLSLLLGTYFCDVAWHHAMHVTAFAIVFVPRWKTWTERVLLFVLSVIWNTVTTRPIILCHTAVENVWLVIFLTFKWCMHNSWTSEVEDLLMWLKIL